MAKVLAAIGMVVAVVGATLTWAAVEALGDAWADLADARREVVDLERTLGARLDEQVGMAGTDGGFPTEDDELAALLADLTDRVGREADVLAEGMSEIEAELHDHVREHGAPDERLLVSLRSVVDDLRDTVVDPEQDAVSDALDRTRVAIASSALATVALWSAALWSWSPRRGRRRRSPDEDPARA